MVSSVQDRVCVGIVERDETVPASETTQSDRVGLLAKKTLEKEEVPQENGNKRNFEEISGRDESPLLDAKRTEFEPISVGDAKEQIYEELDTLTEMYKLRLTKSGYLCLNVFRKMLIFCNSEKSLISALTKMNQKLESLKQGRSAEDVEVAERSRERIETLIERLK